MISYFPHQRMPGFCKWTDEDAKITSSVVDKRQNPRRLWCTELPVPGKSVLASSIIQTLH